MGGGSKFYRLFRGDRLLLSWWCRFLLRCRSVLPGSRNWFRSAWSGLLRKGLRCRLTSSLLNLRRSAFRRKWSLLPGLGLLRFRCRRLFRCFFGVAAPCFLPGFLPFFFFRLDAEHFGDFVAIVSVAHAMHSGVTFPVREVTTQSSGKVRESTQSVNASAKPLNADAFGFVPAFDWDNDSLASLGAGI